MRTTFAALCLLLLALSAGCRSQTAADTRSAGPRFSHARCMGARSGCTNCHATVDAQGTAHYGTLPTRDKCVLCHTGPEAEARVDAALRNHVAVDRGLVFPHDSHVARTNGGCVQCHGRDAEGRTLTTFEPVIPVMTTCTGNCHAADMQTMNCQRCHTTLSRYRAEDVSSFRHGPDFARRHASAARAGGTTCAQCHDPSFCARCHTASPAVPLADFEPLSVLRQFVHRGDFRARHGDEARLSQGTCLRCHGVDQCDACHRTSGVGGSVGPRAVHPAGWLDPMSPNSHARDARRNLLTCAGCHESDAERTCTPCHRAGGAAGNPHPPGFRTGLDEHFHTVCVVCHTTQP